MKINHKIDFPPKVAIHFEAKKKSLSIEIDPPLFQMINNETFRKFTASCEHLISTTIKQKLVGSAFLGVCEKINFFLLKNLLL